MSRELVHDINNLALAIRLNASMIRRVAPEHAAIADGIDEAINSVSSRLEREFGPAIAAPVLDDVTPHGAADGRPLVLVAEDDPALQRLLTLLLNREGYASRIVDTGWECVARALDHRELPDLLIQDVGLPGLDGVSCIRQIRAWRPLLPIILTPGLPGDNEATTLGVNVLAKPYDPVQLLDQMRTLLADRIA